ncbi:MAG: hypothetical protein MJ133_08495 [Lachnospiraceae bacterium]|nr:hypothetical protein [Lachnospiraceae bacterium]
MREHNGVVEEIPASYDATTNTITFASAKYSTYTLVSLYTEKPFCFNKSILNAMKNSNKSFVYYFMYKGHLYSVTIPAGTDASKVLEKNGYTGPFYVGKILGTTKFIK